MYEKHTQQQVDELIARRRARTQELKHKRKRIFFLLLSMIVLGIALLCVLGIFLAHSFAGKNGTTPADGSGAPQNVQASVPETPSQGGDADSAVAPAPPEPAEPVEPEPTEPDEANTAPQVTPSQADPSGTGTEEQVPGAYADTVIFVDPGRGFADQGGSSSYLNGSYESEINLAVGLQLAEMLRDYGFTVVMTHDTNEIPEGESEEYELDQLTRVAMANDGGCDLYLSLHCDNFPDNSAASGTRLYYCTDSAGSATLADTLAAAIGTQMGLSPRISGYGTDRAFIVTSQIEAPSVLIELAFVTNETDAKNLLDETWRSQIARAIADGAIAYFVEHIQEG